MFCGDLEQRLIVSIQKKGRKEMYQLTQQSFFLKRKQDLVLAIGTKSKRITSKSKELEHMANLQ